MKDFLPIVQDINRHINSFNKFLKEEYQVSTLDDNFLHEDSYFHTLKGKTWEQVKFPRNCEVGGVYFYFGRSEHTPHKFCIYIGKASLNATTGQRLWTHFKHAFDENGNVYKDGNSGERFQIEGITLIPFESVELICFAPALEEHLIVELSKEGKYDLVNIRGNR